MVTSSRARIAFDELVSDAEPFAFLLRIASDKDARLSAIWQESEWLDYKEAAFIDAPIDLTENEAEVRKARDDEIKKTWSENLAAFANTSGGLLIWGVKTKGRQPHKVSLAANVCRLANRLRELQNDAVDAPIPGVEVVEIIENERTERGFVVCYIPLSDFAPHRALWATREYYMRVNDSNRTIPTALLRRMFYPTSDARLVVRAGAHMAKSDYEGFLFQMHVDLINRGNLSAEEVCVRIQSPLIPSQNEIDWNPRPHPNNMFDCKVTIHPGQEINFLRNLTERALRTEWPEESTTLQVTFDVFTKNSPAMRSQIQYSIKELKDAFSSGKKIIREGKPELILH